MGKLRLVKIILKINFIFLKLNKIFFKNIFRLSLDITDRLIFLMLSNIYCEHEISQIPIYFSKTLLENDGTGKVPYKMFTVNLNPSNKAKLIILSDSNLNMKLLSDSFNSNFFDEFFLSRLMSFSNVTQFGNSIDTTAKR